MPKILLIEDNSEISKMLCKFLERENFEVILKEDGSKAIDALEQGQKYDLILTDLIMPKGDGFDVLFYVRDNNINIPTIVISGGGVTISPQDTLKTVNDLATMTIAKPLDLDILLEAIKKLIAAD